MNTENAQTFGNLYPDSIREPYLKINDSNLINKILFKLEKSIYLFNKDILKFCIFRENISKYVKFMLNT